MALPKKLKKFEISVVECTGDCPYEYKVGEKFIFEGLKTKEGFCGAAYHTLFPVIFNLNFGGKYPFMEDPYSIDTTTCPDGGKIRFKTRRMIELEEEGK